MRGRFAARVNSGVSAVHRGTQSRPASKTHTNHRHALCVRMAPLPTRLPCRGLREQPDTPAGAARRRWACLSAPCPFDPRVRPSHAQLAELHLPMHQHAEASSGSAEQPCSFSVGHWPRGHQCQQSGCHVSAHGGHANSAFTACQALLQGVCLARPSRREYDVQDLRKDHDARRDAEGGDAEASAPAASADVGTASQAAPFWWKVIAFLPEHVLFTDCATCLFWRGALLGFAIGVLL